MRCYPLTVMDAYGRYLLRWDALLEANDRDAGRICESAFQKNGE